MARKNRLFAKLANSINATTGRLEASGLSENVSTVDSAEVNSLIDAQVSNLVNAAPDTLNTLDELAAALGDDANFATTVTTGLASKANAADVPTDISDLTDTTSLLSSGGGGGGANTKTYSYSGSIQENVSTERLYVAETSTLNSIRVDLGTQGNTSTEIQILKNGVVINTIAIPANTSSVVTNSTESISAGDYFTVDITKSSSATNLYVTLLYGSE